MQRRMETLRSQGNHCMVHEAEFNPFGSFRHSGPFPDSLFGDDGRSIETTAPNVSMETNPFLLDDGEAHSEHIYVNLAYDPVDYLEEEQNDDLCDIYSRKKTTAEKKQNAACRETPGVVCGQCHTVDANAKVQTWLHVSTVNRYTPTTTTTCLAGGFIRRRLKRRTNCRRNAPFVRPQAKDSVDLSSAKRQKLAKKIKHVKKVLYDYSNACQNIIETIAVL